jgi:hypothetical protein
MWKKTPDQHGGTKETTPLQLILLSILGIGLLHLTYGF